MTALVLVRATGPRLLSPGRTLPYKNGPQIWSDDKPGGAYGMAVVLGTRATKTDSCPPVPASSPFAKLVPKKLTNGVKDCLLSCNITEVERTGTGPCHVLLQFGPGHNEARRRLRLQLQCVQRGW